MAVLHRSRIPIRKKIPTPPPPLISFWKAPWNLQQTLEAPTSHSSPVYLTRKASCCAIMQHWRLGVHRFIKCFSNYYWLCRRGSMQIIKFRGYSGEIQFIVDNSFYNISGQSFYPFFHCKKNRIKNFIYIYIYSSKGNLTWVKQL